MVKDILFFPPILAKRKDVSSEFGQQILIYLPYFLCLCSRNQIFVFIHNFFHWVMNIVIHREIWEIQKDAFIRRYQKLNPQNSSFDADIARWVVSYFCFLQRLEWNQSNLSLQQFSIVTLILEFWYNSTKRLDQELVHILQFLISYIS